MGSQKVGHNWTTFTLFTIIFLFKLYFYLYVHASSVVSDSLWPHGLYVACQAPFSMGFSRQEYWCVLSFPPQGIFQTQGNLHLLHLLYWQWDSIPLHHLESTLFVQVITVKRKKNHGITEKDVVIVSQSLSCVWLFETPWMFACQALLSSTISWSLLKFMSKINYGMCVLIKQSLKCLKDTKEEVISPAWGISSILVPTCLLNELSALHWARHNG